MKGQEGESEMWINSITWNAGTFVTMVSGIERESIYREKKVKNKKGKTKS